MHRFDFAEIVKYKGKPIKPRGHIDGSQYVDAIFQDYKSLNDSDNPALEWTALEAMQVPDLARSIVYYWDREVGLLEMNWNPLFVNPEWIALKKEYAKKRRMTAEQHAHVIENMKRVAGTDDIDSVDLELRIIRNLTWVDTLELNRD